MTIRIRYIFFFSSRRRHTRSLRDWSSDVCSSDLDEKLREEVLPKNILMIGPTGVGKTEISRRLAKLAGAPFLKVEATKFTEVGYVGRDVEQIVRDLVEIAILQTRERKRKDVQARAQLAAEDRVLAALVGANASPATKDAFRKKLRAGELDDKEIEIVVQSSTGAMPLNDWTSIFISLSSSS